MKKSFTPGNWSIGKQRDSVVSDQIPEDYKSGTGHDDIEYYGGFLVAESCKLSDAKLISAAPDMLDVLEQVERGQYGETKSDFIKRIQSLAKQAIIKATE